MSDTKVSYKPYIIGSSHTSFTVPTGGIPDYVLITASTIDGGTGGTVYNSAIIIPSGSARIVVTNVISPGFSITNVDIGGVNLVRDSIAINGGETCDIWSLATATIGGPGSYTAHVTVSGNFSNLFSHFYTLSNVTGLIGTGSNTGSGGSPLSATLSPSGVSGNLVFAAAFTNPANESPGFGGTTPFPFGGYTSTQVPGGWNIADWKLTTGLTTAVYGPWTGSKTTALAIASYG